MRFVGPGLYVGPQGYIDTGRLSGRYITREAPNRRFQPAAIKNAGYAGGKAGRPRRSAPTDEASDGNIRRHNYRPTGMSAPPSDYPESVAVMSLKKKAQATTYASAFLNGMSSTS